MSRSQEIPSYLRQLTYALRRGILGTSAFDRALSGPFNKLRSAGSQPSLLSVSAHLFLSPHQRFKVLSYAEILPPDPDNVNLFFILLSVFYEPFMIMS